MPEMHFDWQDKYTEARRQLETDIDVLDLRKIRSPHNIVVIAKKEKETWDQTYPQLGSVSVVLEIEKRLLKTKNPERKLRGIVELAEERGVRVPVQVSSLKHQARFALINLIDD